MFREQQRKEPDFEGSLGYFRTPNHPGWADFRKRGWSLPPQAQILLLYRHFPPQELTRRAVQPGARCLFYSFLWFFLVTRDRLGPFMGTAPALGCSTAG